MPAKSDIVSSELPCYDSCDDDELPSVEPERELVAGGVGGNIDERVDSMD